MWTWQFPSLNKQPRGLRRGHGYTLIEVVVALALAAAMLTATLGVVGRMARRLQTIREHQVTEPWKEALLRQLRDDVANSQRMELSDHQLLITGHGGRSYPDGARTFHPVEVSYRVHDISGEHWLIRDERSLHGRLRRSNLVCAGVRQFVDLENQGPFPSPVSKLTPERIHISLRDAAGNELLALLHLQ